jgi:hypothetical protein
MNVNINEYPILIMTLNCFPSKIEDVHELGYADALNDYETNNPDDGGYQTILDSVFIETDIEVIGMSYNHDVICVLSDNEREAIILKDTIVDYLHKFHDQIFNEYSFRSSIDIESLSFEEIDVELFNQLFSTQPYFCRPFELAGHFEFIDTIKSNSKFN